MQFYCPNCDILCMHNILLSVLIFNVLYFIVWTKISYNIFSKSFMFKFKNTYINYDYSINNFKVCALYMNTQHKCHVSPQNSLQMPHQGQFINVHDQKVPGGRVCEECSFSFIIEILNWNLKKKLFDYDFIAL